MEDVECQGQSCEICEQIEEEICNAELAGCSVFIEFDANSKLGPNIIPGDPHNQTPNGKILMEIVKKHDLSIINGTKPALYGINVQYFMLRFRRKI